MSPAVFVTGGSRGLGLEIARIHARRGDRVALLARRPEVLEEAARALGPEAHVTTFPADVRDDGAVARAVAAFAETAGPIARVYANAGRIEPPSLQVSFDREVFETNFYGVVHLIEAWIRSGPPAGSAAGIVSSFSAFRGLPGLPAYGSSKAAVTLYAESVRGRVRPRSLTVTTAFLGYLETELASSAKPAFLRTGAGRAAEIVVRAVDRGATRVSYPPLVHAMVLAMRALPDAIYDRLVARRYRSGPS